MSADAPPPSFEGLGIDAKILQALQKRKFQRPTAVQAACIPKALLGRDLVVTARTGAGKTIAYLVPALQRLLETSQGGEGGKGGKGKRQPFQTLILVPTRELCEQILLEAKLLALACSGAIRVTSLNGEGRALQQSATTAGQIVVATPGRVAELIRSGVSVLGEHLAFMVLDEADLLLSYGYEEDMDVIAPCVPRSCQCMLVSATTSEAVLKLTKLVLTNPVSLDLTSVGVSQVRDGNVEGNADGVGEGGGEVGGADVDHRELALPSSCGKPGSLTEMTERLLLLLTLLKFGLVDKKVLIFVNSPDVGMRTRLFLDAFGIRCSELHAEMPLNTRNHVLQQFNKGLFDYLIATDDVYVSRDAAKSKPAKGKGSGARAPGKVKNEEAGVTRGIDFRGVKTVINLEMPPSVAGYVHRVGRTGRGGESGTAVTLFSASDDKLRESIKEVIQSTQQLELQPFDKVTKAAVEGLRYRAEDVSRSITKSVIREARTKDIKTELMNSKRLEEFFEERPADLRLIKHDRSVASSAASAAAPHLKHVPGYLRDPLLQGKSFVGRPGNGFLPVRKRRKTDAILDPVKGFMKAPRKGEVDTTAMELRAEEAGKRERKRLKKKGVALPGEDTFVKKRNVRKKR